MRGVLRQSKFKGIAAEKVRASIEKKTRFVKAFLLISRLQSILPINNIRPVKLLLLLKPTPINLPQQFFPFPPQET